MEEPVEDLQVPDVALLRVEQFWNGTLCGNFCTNNNIDIIIPLGAHHMTSSVQVSPAATLLCMGEGAGGCCVGAAAADAAPPPPATPAASKRAQPRTILLTPPEAELATAPATPPIGRLVLKPLACSGRESSIEVRSAQ